MSSLSSLTPRQGLLLLIVCLLLSIIPFILNLRLNEETATTSTPTTIQTTVPLSSPTAIRAAQLTATARFGED